MAGFTLPPDPENVGGFMDWARQNRRVLQEALDYFNGLRTVQRTWGVQLPNRLILGCAVGAPTFPTINVGTLSGSFDYAYGFGSTEGDLETILSPAGSTGAVVNASIEIEGERNPDERLSNVLIFRRDTGEGDAAWLRVASIENPDSGPWTYDDEAAKSSLSVQPMAFEQLLWVVCGPRWFMNRVKIAWDRDYAANSSAYYEFWLAFRREGFAGYEMITKPQSTATVSLLSDYIYHVPWFTPDSRNPNPDMNLLLPEDARVYLMGRGVGGVAPLPSGLAQVVVSRQEG